MTAHHLNNLRSVYDGLPLGSADKWLHYLDIYDQWFRPLRYESIKILELGVDRGGPLLMWRRYFGSSAHIHGADIKAESAFNLNVVAAQAHVVIGDLGRRDFIEHLAGLGPWDIVIDDASHHASHQFLAWSLLSPVTTGFYCIEDTHTALWPAFRQPSYPADALELGMICATAMHDYFLKAGTSEVFSNMPWPNADKICDVRKHMKAVHFYDSLIIMEMGPNGPPERRPRTTSEEAVSPR